MKKSTDPGYILLSRRLLSNWIYTAEPFTKAQAWIDLLFLANYKKSSYMCRGTRIQIDVGQLAYSQETLAGKWRWSRGKVIRFLNGLEMEQMIVQNKTGVSNLITIVNYKSYQRHGTNNGTTRSTLDGTTVGTHPKERERKKTSASAVSDENGFAPIQKL